MTFIEWVKNEEDFFDYELMSVAITIEPEPNENNINRFR